MWKISGNDPFLCQAACNLSSFAKDYYCGVIAQFIIKGKVTPGLQHINTYHAMAKFSRRQTDEMFLVFLPRK